MGRQKLKPRDARELQQYADELKSYGIFTPNSICISDDKGIQTVSEITIDELQNINNLTSDLQSSINDAKTEMNNISNYILNDINNLSTTLQTNTQNFSNISFDKYNNITLDNFNSTPNLKVIENNVVRGDLTVQAWSLNVSNLNKIGDDTNFKMDIVDGNSLDINSDSLSGPALNISQDVVNKGDVLNVNVQNENKMKIKSTGFVGISNDTPTTELDIQGDIKFTGLINNVSSQDLSNLSNLQTNIQQQIDEIGDKIDTSGTESSLANIQKYCNDLKNVFDQKTNNVVIDSAQFINSNKEHASNLSLNVTDYLSQKQDEIVFNNNDFNYDADNKTISLKANLKPWNKILQESEIIIGETNYINSNYLHNDGEIQIFQDNIVKISNNSDNIDVIALNDGNSEKQDTIIGAATSLLQSYSNFNSNEVLISTDTGKITTTPLDTSNLQIIIGDTTCNIQQQFNDIYEKIINSSNNVITSLENFDTNISNYVTSAVPDTSIYLDNIVVNGDNGLNFDSSNLSYTGTVSVAATTLNSPWTRTVDVNNVSYLSYSNINVYNDEIYVQNIPDFQPTIVSNDSNIGLNDISVNQDSYLYSFTQTEGHNYITFPVDINVDVFMVGGGGSGGGNNGYGGEGGEIKIVNLNLQKNVTYDVTVGKGGIASLYQKGGTSYAFGETSRGGNAGLTSSDDYIDKLLKYPPTSLENLTSSELQTIEVLNGSYGNGVYEYIYNNDYGRTNVYNGTTYDISNVENTPEFTDYPGSVFYIKLPYAIILKEISFIYDEQIGGNPDSYSVFGLNENGEYVLIDNNTTIGTTDVTDSTLKNTKSSVSNDQYYREYKFSILSIVGGSGAMVFNDVELYGTSVHINNYIQSNSSNNFLPDQSFALPGKNFDIVDVIEQIPPEITGIVGKHEILSYTTLEEEYEYAQFTDNGAITFFQDTICDVLVVGGGGGGYSDKGGGGGGGAVVHITNGTFKSGAYDITVGEGGSGASNSKGNNSTIIGQDISIIAEGGGKGGHYSAVDVAIGQPKAAGTGGSGGGAGGDGAIGDPYSFGAGVGTESSLGGFSGTIYGNKGGDGLTRTSGNLGAGGGGGAGAEGGDGNIDLNNIGGNGGDGIQINIDGNNYYWGGGGGGSTLGDKSGNGGKGGGGGGGVKGDQYTVASGYGLGGGYSINSGGNAIGSVAGHGGENTGGGGGGGGHVAGALAGNGGSGIVIIRWKKFNQQHVPPIIVGKHELNSEAFDDYEYVEFTEDSSIAFGKNTICDILVVGGGSASNPGENGASSGGLLYYTNALITKGSIYNISIGKAGQNPGENGNSSSISKGNDSMIAVGGGSIVANTNDLFTSGTLENDLISSEQPSINNITGSLTAYGGNGKLFDSTLQIQNYQYTYDGVNISTTQFPASNSIIDRLYNSDGNGITNVVNNTVTQTIAQGSTNMSSSVFFYSDEDLVARCFTKLPPSSINFEGVLWESGGGGHGACLVIRDNGTVMRLRAGEGISLNTSTDTTAILDIPYADFEKYVDNELHEIAWEFRIGKDGSFPGRIRLWIDGELMGSSTTTGTNNQLGKSTSKIWGGTDPSGYGTVSTDSSLGNTPIIDEPQGDWWSLSDYSEMNYYRARLVSDDNNVNLIQPVQIEGTNDFYYNFGKNVIDRLYNSDGNGITNVVNNTVTQTIAQGSTDISSTVFFYSDEDLVARCFTKLPPSSINFEGVLWECGADGHGACLVIRDNGTVMRLRAGEGISLNTSTDTTAILDIPYADFEKYVDNELHEIVWEFRIGKDGSFPGRIRLWIDGELMGSSTTTGTNNQLGSVRQWAGIDPSGYGTISTGTIIDEPQGDWWSLSDYSEMNYYRARLVGDNLTYFIKFSEDTACDLLTTIDDNVSETVTFLQNQIYQVNLFDTTWEIVNDTTSEILTSGTSQNIIVKWSMPPVLNKYGYGGNSTIQNFYPGGDGVVIIKWKKDNLITNNYRNYSIGLNVEQIENIGYEYAAFKSDGMIFFPTETNCDIFMIGGGGAGGHNHGGGGGAGAYRLENHTFNGSYNITVGQGGIGDPAVGGIAGNGTKSEISNGIFTISVDGGGGGGTADQIGQIGQIGFDGGSGGGGAGWDGIEIKGGGSVIACGDYHSIFVDEDGNVYSTGRNGDGQLGYSGTQDRFAPGLISGILTGKKIVHVACGISHSLFLDEDGNVYSTGWNTYGQLGYSGNQDRFTPELISGILTGKKIVHIACGYYHSIFVDEDGNVYSTGRNEDGQLGYSGTAHRFAPELISGILTGKKIVHVACGASHSIFVDEDGNVYSTGENYDGQLGYSGSLGANDRFAPELISGILTGKKIIQVAGGTNHSLFVDEDGNVYSTGWNTYGQLGYSGTQDRFAPVLISGILTGKKIIQVACGPYHSIFVDEDGNVYSTGRNGDGQLGYSGTANRFAPVLISGLKVSVQQSSAPSEQSILVGGNVTGNGIGYKGGTGINNYGGQFISGGGGGGIGSVGKDPVNKNGGDGGDGLVIGITGEKTIYGGGGAGGTWPTYGVPGTPGGAVLNGQYVSVGGVGTNTEGEVGGDGVENTGSGGGSGKNNAGGNGGSGIVIIRWKKDFIINGEYGSGGDGGIINEIGENGKDGIVAIKWKDPELLYKQRVITENDLNNIQGKLTFSEDFIYNETDNSVGLKKIKWNTNDIFISNRNTRFFDNEIELSQGDVYVDTITTGNIKPHYSSSSMQLGNNAEIHNPAYSENVIKYDEKEKELLVVDADTVVRHKFNGFVDSIVRTSGDNVTRNETDEFEYAEFKTDGTIFFHEDTECDVLVVGGGGGSGFSLAGGGGGGGVAYIQNFVFTNNNIFDIKVGKGGLGLIGTSDSTNNNGEDSIISLNGVEMFKGIGGGGSVGQSYAYNNRFNSSVGIPRPGGSGAGGVRHSNTGAVSTQNSANLITGTLLYGNSGGNGTNSGGSYAGGGGGGAGTQGGNATSTNAGNGGDGIAITITGQEVYYGGGGGGGGSTVNTVPKGGLGGGGDGGVDTSPYTVPTNGIDGLGGGAGGGISNTGGKKGGDGIVIIRWKKKKGIYSYISENNIKYDYIEFKSDTKVSFSKDVECDVFMIGGGGGGGHNNGGGGGAGAYRLENHTFNGSYNITVGQGGNGGTISVPASNGTRSEISNGVFTISVDGGGSGGTADQIGQIGFDGGSGGGGAGWDGFSIKGGGSVVACGYYHSLFVDEDGNVYSTGGNTDGQLGYSGTQDRFAPELISGILTGKKIIQVAGGTSHSIFLDEDGNVYSTGGNSNGQLGYSGSQDRFAPEPISDILTGKKIIQVAGGQYHSLFVDEDGNVYSTGRNTDGQLGYSGSLGANDRFAPELISGILTGKKIIQVACGFSHSIFLDEDGNVYSTGQNTYGQLGYSGSQDRFAPQLISSILTGKKIVHVACGDYHSIFVDEDGNVYSTGRNEDGQLGYTGTSSRFTPVLISGILTGKKIVRVACGAYHSLFVDEDGNVYSTGRNTNGQLGYSGSLDRFAPELISGILTGKKIIQVAGGTSHSLFVDEDGNVYSTGRNTYGQLGYSGTQDRFAPELISGLKIRLSEHILVGGNATGNGIGYKGGLGINNDSGQFLSGGGGGGIGSEGKQGVNENGGDGGDGLVIDITGEKTIYGGGGAGGTWSTYGVPGTPGGAVLNGQYVTVGGNVAITEFQNGGDGVENTGSGGGSGKSAIGGKGGSGVVIIRWKHDPTLFTSYCLNTKKNIWFDESTVVYTSDERVKKEIKDIDDEQALQKILGLQPKTYKYIDHLNKGNNDVYGFISQQVRDVFPEATNTISNYIPNIYDICEYANDIITIPENIDISTLGLSSGTNSVKLINQNKDSLHRDFVLKELETGGYGMQVRNIDNFVGNTSKIFVYGTKVDDMVTLDKSYLFTLNVCATQILNRKINTLEQKNMALLTRIDELENELSQIEISNTSNY